MRLPLRLFGLAALMLLPALSGAEEPRDRIQGNWLGEWKLAGGGGGKQVAQIVALGNGEYQAVFTAYDGSDLQSETFRFLISGTQVDDKAQFTTQIDLGNIGVFDFSTEVVDGRMTGKFSNKKNYIGTLDLKRIEKKPDSVGAPPLEGAVMLFDGRNLEAWRPLPAAAWEQRGGTLRNVARGGDAKLGQHLAQRAPHGSAQIHVEYRTPLMPEARGTERGKGGLFLQGRYEIQIVDSFGQPRRKNNFGDLADDDSAGAIFKYAAPLENVTLPPGEWQALDITFQAAELAPDGKLLHPAEITVYHNGTLIHDRVKIRKPTEGAPVQDLTTESGLVLEDAGQAVEYRNIWLVPLVAR